MALCAGKAVLKCATGNTPYSRGLSKRHPVCNHVKRFSNLGLGASLHDDSIDVNTRFEVQKELPHKDIVKIFSRVSTDARMRIRGCGVAQIGFRHVTGGLSNPVARDKTDVRTYKRCTGLSADTLVILALAQ